VSQWDRERRRNRVHTPADEFVHQTLAFQRSLADIVIDVALLMLWNVLLFLGANMAFLRYDVR
jgi:hypothetical protein